ncbi:hypothetical protein [Acinetobacter baumannii]|uniref:hypothetical protein n=1 Tax=Acinetobacter baumannii TaxID=470 RepID=UPI0008DC6317|nr:hypothetical protein [Acinetobacter baumannii]OIF77424.1 hypothetical protein A7M51_14935 [Acinetobacter baumannii]WOE35315.1 hypothetical protein QSG85_01100 [Acinetobacter baumannii]
MAEFKINIEGNFLDSFIYSGVLFTVDVDGILCTYSWNDLIKEYIKKDIQKKCFENKLIDARVDQGLKFQKDLVIELDRDFLETYQKGICVELDTWSTDLDIRDSILYISSERGLEALPFRESWENGKIMHFNDLYKVWGESKVFGVSTGSWGRTLVAAGCHGALEIINNVEQNNIIDLKQQEGKVLNEEICLDCEWELNSTIAILEKIDEQVLLEYEKLMSDQSFKSYAGDTLEAKEKKLRERDSIPEEEISYLREYIKNGIPNNLKNTTVYSWFDGKKLVGLDQDNNSLFYDFDKNEWIIRNHNKILDESSYRKIRQTNAGLIIETEDDSLYRKGANSNKLLSKDVSTWRVFPRSRNYLDRIHIVNEDYLQISIFD